LRTSDASARTEGWKRRIDGWRIDAAFQRIGVKTFDIRLAGLMETDLDRLIHSVQKYVWNSELGAGYA